MIARRNEPVGGGSPNLPLVVPGYLPADLRNAWAGSAAGGVKFDQGRTWTIVPIDPADDDDWPPPGESHLPALLTGAAIGWLSGLAHMALLWWWRG